MGKRWREQSFIRVDWPVVRFDDVLRGLDSPLCSHIEIVCVSMVTNRKAREDTLQIVQKVRGQIGAISTLIAPTIADKEWLHQLKAAGTDKVGIAMDTATPDLFSRLRGRGIMGPHRWGKYWKTIRDAVGIFGMGNVGIHLIVGLGETEQEMVNTIQAAHDLGASTHPFSFFPEDGSVMANHPQPPIGKYRRIQVARYLINKGITSAGMMKFDDSGRLIGFGIDEATYRDIVGSGLPFMTSGCSGRNRENACNRPFSDYTAYQAYIGEVRNYPFIPNKEDIALIVRQLNDYSDKPVQVWLD